MKIGVLGAGISGLSISKLLSDSHQVEVLESCNKVGGIAKTENIDGIPYHLVGGHCFNSKYPEVLDFVFNKVLSKDKWDWVKRKSAIKFQNHVIPYPIEYAIKDIYEFNPDLALKITTDFLTTPDKYEYENLENWFRGKFGDTLAENYFIPYNHKIWNLHPSEMSYKWVEDKLPIPDKSSFLKNFFEKQSDEMSHYHFYYPKNNHLNTFINSLASGLNITLNYKVKEIKFIKETQKWRVNNGKEYDLLISTIPLNIIPSIIDGCPSNVQEEAKKLKYNRVTTVLWESHKTENTWTYIPQSDSIFHRYIHIGNFPENKKNFTITEAIGEKSYPEMVENGIKDPFLIKPLAYNVSDHAYVVFDENHERCKTSVKRYLEKVGIFSLGRFGEWEYYNMDICIKKSLDLFKLIKDKY